MKRTLSITIVLISLLISELAFSQSLRTPYPIIFVHGINSSDEIWNTGGSNIKDFLQNGASNLKYGGVLNVSLDHDRNAETMNSRKEDDVYLFTNHNFGDFYTVNFDLHANGKRHPKSILTILDQTILSGTDKISVDISSDIEKGDIIRIENEFMEVIDLSYTNFLIFPCIELTVKRGILNTQDNNHLFSYYSAWNLSNESNQASIAKQGLGIDRVVEAVKINTRASKVILVCHSMGGLAAREYIQSQGYRNDVAKIVTIGTPHKGSDITDTPDFLMKFKGVDGMSDAVRDLRTTIQKLSTIPGVYLFGGNENIIPENEYYSKDVNSDGNETDWIYGLNDFVNRKFPENISRTWIVSSTKLLSNTDDVVFTENQYIEPKDTIETKGWHLAEPTNIYALIRGLDEPDDILLAYEIGSNCSIVGFITNQNKSPNTDIDLYKINLASDGFLTVNMTASSGSRIGRISILNSNQTERVAKGVQEYSYSTDLSSPIPAGTYYIQVRGLADTDSYKYRYTLSTKFSQLNLQFPNGNDQLKIGSTALIQWTSNNIDNLKIEYSINGGTDWNSIITNATASSGSYSWIVPNELSNNCKIRISDVLNSEVSDQSDAVFSIMVSEPQGITTAVPTDITSTIATCGGNITSDGGSPITIRGVCWSISQNPTIDNSKTEDGSGIGSFMSNLSGLSANTAYYVRAYASNIVGTVYGAQVNFITTSFLYTNLTRLEYFFDSDPGLGKATSITISPSPYANVNTKISLSNVSTGLHRLYFRTRDENGKWSSVYSKPVLVKTEQTNTPITKIEYFLDEKPSNNTGNSLNFTASKDVSVSKNLSLANVSPGLHRIYFKAQDESGRWSTVHSKPLLVTTESATAPITKIEYFLDESSPNVGTKALSFSPSTDVAVTQNISLTNISTGLHRIYFKAQDETGRWSALHSKPVLINNYSNNLNISRLEYFIDYDPGVNSGISIPFTSGSDVSVNSNIPLDTISLGLHNIYFRAKDSRGIWSFPQYSPFTIENSSADFAFNTGWNIFSTYITPNNSDLKTIFQPLIDSGSLKKVMDEAGKTIENFGAFGGWKNNIGNLNIAKGYKVNVTAASTLSLEGTPVQLPMDIALNTGWNIISYPSTAIQDAKALVQVLIDAGKLKKVMDETGKTIENFGAFGGWKNNIGNFNTGKGYKVNVTETCLLTIPASGTKSAVVLPELLASEHFRPVFIGNGTDHMNIHLINLQNSGLLVDDEIGIFDGKLCAGSATIGSEQLISGSISIPASANDELYETANGFTPGHTVELQLYRGGKTYQLRLAKLIGNESFEKNGSLLAQVNANDLTTVQNTDDSALFKCYPNPFTQEITIEVQNLNEKNITVEIFNMAGQRIKNVYKGTNPGNLVLKWNGTNDSGQQVAPGVYLCKVNGQSKQVIFEGGK